MVKNEHNLVNVVSERPLILNIKKGFFWDPLSFNSMNKLAVDIAAPKIEMFRARATKEFYEWGHWGGLGLIGNYSPLLKLRFPIILKIQVLSFFWYSTTSPVGILSEDLFENYKAICFLWSEFLDQTPLACIQQTGRSPKQNIARYKSLYLSLPF